ncbi:MAG: alpha/beta fold hydrolase [Deltaproteobacteria bacterium]
MRDVPHTELAKAQANGIEIAYDTFGNPGDPPLLLIMGLGAQMIHWDEEFCKRLAARGYWVIRFDNRDVGLSTHFHDAEVPDIPAVMERFLRGEPAFIPYTLKDMGEDAVGLLDALGIESAHVVGISMGGMIGQLIAIHFPERIRTLTCLMSTTGEPGLPPPTPEAMSVLMTPLPTERTAYIEDSARIWRVIAGPKFQHDDSQARKWAELAHDRGLNPDGIARQMAAITASGGRRRALESVAVPTLVIHGDGDPLLPLECGKDIADAIPGAKLMIIEGLGHALPEAVWTEVIDAIAEHAH